jgi:hypothetical protein
MRRCVWTNIPVSCSVTGRTGRRAVLVGGSDVREVIRAVKSARAAEPDGRGRARRVEHGSSARLIDVAVRYWSSYPDEIDAWIERRKHSRPRRWPRGSANTNCSRGERAAPRRDVQRRSPSNCALAASTPSPSPRTLS